MSPLHILHLSPPPSLSLLCPSHLTVFAPFLHPFLRRGGSPIWRGLLTWVSVGGASRWRILFRRQPILAWGQKKKNRNERNMNRATGDGHISPQKRKKKTASRDRNRDRRALIKASLSVRKDHILIGPPVSPLV